MLITIVNCLSDVINTAIIDLHFIFITIVNMN